MSLFEAIALIFISLIFLIWWLGYTINMGHRKKLMESLIAHDCVRYHPETGEKIWAESQDPVVIGFYGDLKEEAIINDCAKYDSKTGELLIKTSSGEYV